ncbi:MAG: ribosomal protein S18 acetylase RimI-like enzyme [Paracoccaceae bacterium]|jgi:ribosomal protein S18 acetylase RimI-like enzyme
MIADASSDAAFCAKLEEALLDDLRTTSIQGVNSRISLSVLDADGSLLAGLSGATSYGWLRVNMLWVLADHRRSGMGSQLMNDAIELSLERGCHAAWLETSNPQARTFYEGLGFEAFAELANDAGAMPESHTRWFLRRTLMPSQLGESP